ncbi:MAG: tetratricopeptide repeat protein [Lachnospiraceae bacterium]|nr:tetratricopeptide repeat protein [Lachnospiraceae bacterium]
MKCYKCGAELMAEHDFCPACRADVSAYKRILGISNRFYNDGLEKARERDLTGAINDLRSSLKFNKLNIEARNLLGLVYFESGEVVAALSEWVISKNLLPKMNIADDYISMIQTNQVRLETINQTIKKYNQALAYCNQDALDLAVIQLKKVITLNPNFIRARQLLALLYINGEDWKSAYEQLVRCREIDRGSPKTLRFIREIEDLANPPEDQKGRKGKGGKKEKPSEPAVIKYTSGNETIIQPVMPKEHRGISIFLNMIIGIGIGIAASFFLVLPARIQNANSAAEARVKEVGEQLDERNASINELNREIELLNEKNENLKKEMEDLQGSDGVMAIMGTLDDAVTAYLNNPEDLETVSGLIAELNTNASPQDLPDPSFKLYEALLKVVGPDLVERQYEAGMQAVAAGDYASAITDFTSAYEYDNSNADYLYELANAFSESGNEDMAVAKYQEVIDNFPDSSRARVAKRRITELGGEVKNEGQ